MGKVFSFAFSWMILAILMVSLPIGAYEKIKDYLSITTGAVETRILNGSVDPSASSGVAAPIGSEYLRDNGDSFKKVGSADTAWLRQLNTSTPVGLELFEDPSFEKGLPSYCVKGTYGSLSHAPSILASPSNIKAVRVGVEMNETTTYTCSKAVGSEYTGLPIRHKGWVTLAPIGTFNCSITAQWNGSNVGNTQIITHGNNYYDLEVIPTGAGDTGFQVSCVNPTSVFTGYFSLDETSNKAERLSPVLADVKRTQSETLLNVGNLTQTTNLASFSVENDSGVGGIYTKSTAGLTFHQDADVVITYGQFRAAAGQTDAQIFVNGIVRNAARPASGSGSHVRAVLVRHLKSGDVVTFIGINGDAGVTTNTVEISATATSPTIVMQNETFSTDTNPLTYANSSQYTLSTLANAPVGTYITFTYAANTNTRVQTTGSGTGNLRPTQTDADMNANGIRLYTRAYNAASTGELPAAIAIQIGKGMKGKSLSLYKSVGKVTAGSLDWGTESSAIEFGVRVTDYNEVTGIFIVDAGVRRGTTTTSSILFSDVTSENNGYLVINASKSPSMSGVNVGRVYVSAKGDGSVKSLGQSTEINLYDHLATFEEGSHLWDSVSKSIIIPESGVYNVCALLYMQSTKVANSQGNAVVSIIKNGSLVSDRFRAPYFYSVSGSAKETQAHGCHSLSLVKNDKISFIGGDSNTSSITVFRPLITLHKAGF